MSSCYGLRWMKGCLLYALVLSPMAHTSELASIYKLPAYIQEVTTLGEWYHNNQRGLLRMAITLRNGEYKTFIQWLLQDEVMSTVAIREINQGSRYEVSNPVFSRAENKSFLFLNVRERHTQKAYKVKIEFTGIGYYNCTFLPAGVVAKTKS